MKVISFCIYGDKKKYRKGLLENIEIINKELPDFHIHIAAGNDIEEEYINLLKSYNNVIVISQNFTGHMMMIYRILYFDRNEVDVLFSRDSDSRIDERDIWCMNEFIKSDSLIHIIRDHPEHTMHIMGGMCGFKRIGENKIKFSEAFIEYVNTLFNNNFYGIDQIFLVDFYKIPVKKLIHSNGISILNETIVPIEPVLKDKVSFIGNTIDYDDNDNRVYIYSL